MLKQFVSYLSNILGNNNQLRHVSESKLQQAKENNTNEFIKFLVYIMKSIPKSFSSSDSISLDNQRSDIRHLCAIILRNNISIFIPGRTSIWSSLTKQNQEYVKEILIQTVQSEKENNIMNILCDTIGDLAGTIFSEVDENNNLIGKKGWP